MEKQVIIYQKTLFGIIISLIFFWSSCKNKIPSPDWEKDKLVIKDTLIKEIPLGMNGEYSYGYKSLMKLSSALGIGKLDSGYDSLQIRIWYPEMINSKVISITSESGKWDGYVCKFTYRYDLMNGIDTIINIVKQKIIPRSGWKIFILKLIDLGVTTLPDKHQINVPEYPKGGADGQEYSVEISTRKKYRYYSYYEPFHYKGIKEVARMVDIINYLDNELSLHD